MNDSITYEIIKPVWEIALSGAQNIQRWITVAVVSSPSQQHALDFGRMQYGADIDIRKAGPRFDG